MTQQQSDSAIPVLTAADYPSVIGNADVEYYEARDRLRETAPVYRVDLGAMESFYAVMRDDLAKKILLDPQTFPHIMAFPDETNPHGTAPVLPMSRSGKPDHAHYRGVTQGWVSPARVRTLQPRIREIAIEVIEPLVGKGGCNFVHDFGEVYPGLIMLEALGIDRHHLPRLVEIEANMWIPPEDDPDHSIRLAADRKLSEWIDERIAECQAKPDESIITYLLGAEVQGRKLTPFDAKMYMQLFVVGGIHTTRSLMGKIMAILAADPPTRHRLTANPDLWPRFIEEVLRSHALGNSFRRVARDVEFEGIHFKQNDLVNIDWAAINRDPRTFSNPNQINLDEPQKARHSGFGFGSHICMGMHLARADMRIALEEWHARIPDYYIPEGTVLREQIWAGFGLIELPLRWDI